jgi:VWFA-related protein
VRINRGLACLALCVSTILVPMARGPQAASSVPQDLPVFKSSVDLVSISAVVRDRRGRLVTNLTAGDFQVLDKGERRSIVDFQVDRSSPITMALLVDVSGSMRLGPKLTFARQVLERIAAELEDGRDEVGLFTFDAALHEEQAFTIHPRTIGSLFESVRPFGTTSLYDAIAATARLLDGRPAQRRAVVVFTDGVDTSSVLTPPEVSALASSIDVPVYVVVTAPAIDYVQFDNRPTEAARQAADLRDLAMWTGGDLLFATASEETGMRAHQVVMELRHQYLIAIESAPRSEWRPLDVRVRDARLSVRARSGYFGHDAPPSR